MRLDSDPRSCRTIHIPRTPRRCPRTVVASLALQSPPPSLLVTWTWTSTAQSIFAAYGSRTWNRLPAALRSPELSLGSFKRQLKTHSSVPALDSAGCSQLRSQKFSTGCASICSIPFCPFPFSCPTKSIRYDTRCYFNVRSKADMGHLNLPHGTDN